MKLKIVTAFAAALLLAACASSKEPATTTDQGTGGTQTGQNAPGSPGDFQVNVGDRVFFDYDSYEIRADAQSTLQKQAAWLQQYANYTILVEGHCDERGTREYNLALGERRANSVKNYLVALGLDGNRIQTISYGKEKPDATGHDETAWAQNRRGVTVLQ
jgi:peptidoglycan-associated lipoprotein